MRDCWISAGSHPQYPLLFYTHDQTSVHNKLPHGDRSLTCDWFVPPDASLISYRFTRSSVLRAMSKQTRLSVARAFIVLGKDFWQQHKTSSWRHAWSFRWICRKVVQSDWPSVFGTTSCFYSLGNEGRIETYEETDTLLTASQRDVLSFVFFP